MKKLILSFLLLFAIVLYTEAQTKNDKASQSPKTAKKKIKREDVPKEVVDVFTITYPNQEVVEWYSYPYYWDFETGDLALDSLNYVIEYEYPEYYEVEIMEENKKKRSVFSRSGKLIQTRTAVAKEELPAVVLDAFNTSIYKNWSIISEREFVRFWEPNLDLYAITVKKGKQRSVLYYDGKTGKLVQIKKIFKK
jgi:hypothetical protein